jgi:hypothetical protein
MVCSRASFTIHIKYVPKSVTKLTKFNSILFWYTKAKITFPLNCMTNLFVVLLEGTAMKILNFKYV